MRSPIGNVAEEPIIHQGTEGVFFGSWKNVLVSIWEAQGTIVAVDRMLDAVAAMPRISPKRSDIYVIAEGARLPESGVRDHFVEVIQSHSADLACVAVVVEGSGFWASALRSFVTGLHWLAPRSFDFKLHGSIDDVITHLPPVHERLSGIHLDHGRFERLIREWRANGMARRS
ncbi:MAG: hypothetical protein ABW133_20755 [Polyangiaceae bacterium]